MSRVTEVSSYTGCVSVRGVPTSTESKGVMYVVFLLFAMANATKIDLVPINVTGFKPTNYLSQ